MPWTIEKAITELGRKLTYEKVEPLKIHDFELLIRKAMYDIKLRVDLEKMEEHDPLLAFETDQVLDEARRIITKSFIDAKTKRGNIAAHFQYTVETAVNKVLETVSLDKDDDIEDFLWQPDDVRFSITILNALPIRLWIKSLSTLTKNEIKITNVQQQQKNTTVFIKIFKALDWLDLIHTVNHLMVW